MNENIRIIEIKNGIELSIENSFALIKDAEILFQNDRYPRAYSLAQLALEEIGKSVMLFDFYHKLQMGKRMSFDFKQFRRNFRNHQSKTFESLFLDILMKGNSKSPDFEKVATPIFKNIQKNKKGYYDNLKNQSLYVSLINNKFKQPSEIFTNEEVLLFLSDAKAKIEFSSENTLKWLRMDEWLGADKEGFMIEL